MSDKPADGPSSADENRRSLHEFKAAPQAFEEHAEKVTVMFADLVGSTAFKYGRAPIVGISKSYEHNSVVESVVESEPYGGTVAKFIGDGAMAYFRGDKAQARAARAAMEIIRRFEDHNSRIPEQDWVHRISTKIGIHHGPVWMMQFKQADRLDPQGPTCDLAARLCDLCPPMHAAMRKDTLDAVINSDVNLEKPDSDVIWQQPQNHFLKGVPGVQEVCALTVRPRHAERIPLPGSIPAFPIDVQRQMKAAAALWEESHDCQAAIDAYRAIVRREPRNFVANHRLAELLAVHHHDDTDGRKERLQEAYERLCEAKAVHPYSVGLWTMLSWVQYVRFRTERESKDPAREDEAKRRLAGAIRDAEHGLHIAEGLADDYGAAVSKIYLIVYANERIRSGYDTPSDDAQVAQRYVSEVSAILDKGLDNWLESQFKVGQALTLRSTKPRGSCDGQVLQLLSEAIGKFPRNKLATAVLLEVQGG